MSASLKAQQPRDGLTVVMVTTAYWERHDKSVSVCATTHAGMQRTVRFPPGHAPMDDHLSAAMTAASAGLMKYDLPDHTVVGVDHALDGKVAARFTLRYRTDPDSTVQPPLDGDLSVVDGVARLWITTGNIRRSGEVLAYWCNGAETITWIPTTNDLWCEHRRAADECATAVLDRLGIKPAGAFEQDEAPVGVAGLAGECVFLLRCPVQTR